MADYNKKLSELHQRVVRDKLGVPATIDEHGWVQFSHSDLGELTIYLREYSPEYMTLGCSFDDKTAESHAARSREDLMQICNIVNEESTLAHLNVGTTSCSVSASVRLLLTAPGRMPDEALLGEVIGPAISSIKTVAAQLADALPKLDSARKVVNDHLSLVYRPGMTSEALLKAYTSSPAFAEDRLTAENIGSFFLPYPYARTRCTEMCGSVSN